MKNSERIRETIAANAAEMAELETEITYLKARIEEIEVDWRNCRLEFRRLEGKLKIAERTEQDELLPVVQWKVKPLRWGRDYNTEYVVDKITPKRIYIRERGTLHTTRYHNRADGSNACECDGVIDVAAMGVADVEV